MNEVGPENLDRRCEMAAWQAVQITLGATANASAELKVQLIELLQPEDEKSIKLNGQRWARHQCQRCGMAVLRSLSSTPYNETQAIIDVRRGECITSYGQEVMQKYPIWPPKSAK